jgi:hypothetical protein
VLKNASVLGLLSFGEYADYRANFEIVKQKIKWIKKRPLK